MTHTDDALTEAVAKAIYDQDPKMRYRIEEPHRPFAWDEIHPDFRDDYLDKARAAITTIRQHDEQAALNCGHCSEPDEIACACEIKERDDER